MINAYEVQDIGIFDAPIEYLYVENPREKQELIKFQAYFIYIMCGVNPEYKEYVIYEHVHNILYLLLIK